MQYFAVLLLLLYISRTDSQTVNITPRDNQIKAVDSTIKYTCSVDEWGHGKVEEVEKIVWIGPDHRQIKDTHGRIYTERYNTTSLRLYITRIKDSDSGLYVCEAVINGRTVKAETRMFLFEDIRFAETPTFVKHDIGSSPLLQCIAYGQPNPEVTWRFNGRKISSDKIKYTVESGGLRIKKLDLRDNGMYECRASVESLGTLNIYNITVDVLYAPVIKSKPQSGEVIQGRSHELLCEADGNPPVNYAWYREKHTFGIHVKLKLNSVVGGRYLIKNMTADEEGRYFCNASNSLGEKIIHVDVVMMVPPKITELTKKTVVEGRRLELTCRTSGGVPAPTFTWSRGNTSQTAIQIMLDGGRAFLEKTHSNTSQLVIQDLERSEAGSYWCTAGNLAGSDSKQTSVIVEYVPSVIVTTPMEQRGWPGQRRRFTCLGQGLPLPSITWFRAGQNLSEQPAFTITSSTVSPNTVTSTLEIDIDRRYAGLYSSYSCIAKNHHGYMMEAVHLKEARTPDEPQNVSVLEEGPTWVNLRADRPLRDGGERVESWLVTYERVNPPPMSANKVFRDGGNITVTGLTPDTSYTFHLAAGNAVGFGTPIKFRVQTPHITPPLQPRSAGGVFKEQADVPLGDGDYSISRHDSADFDSDKKKSYDVVINHSPGASTFSTNGMGSLMLAVAIGVAAVLIAIITAVVCVALSSGKNKKRGKSTTAGHGNTHPVPEQLLQTTLERNTHSLGNGTLSRAVPTSPHAGRACRLEKSPSGTPTTLRRGQGPTNEAQRQAWDNMLMKAVETPIPSTLPPCYPGISDQLLPDIPADIRPLSISELPPPPDFLLDTDTVSCLAHEIQDGYRSGDSVDDDIDDMDYTIRAPSYVR